MSLREQFIDRALGSLPKQKLASPHPTTRKKKERRENML
jgi:hypothetical protein